MYLKWNIEKNIEFGIFTQLSKKICTYIASYKNIREKNQQEVFIRKLKCDFKHFYEMCNKKFIFK